MPTWRYVQPVPSAKLRKQVSPTTPMFSTSFSKSVLDKDYRKAVHWLETLRIRRVKILEGGYNVSHTYFTELYHKRFLRQSLERFVFEGTETVKKVLVTYADTMMQVPQT